jgi:hypothetical protein
MKNKLKANDLIKWSELSRALSGSRHTVRENAVPNIHRPFVDYLISTIEEAISNHEQYKKNRQRKKSSDGKKQQ